MCTRSHVPLFTQSQVHAFAWEHIRGCTRSQPHIAQAAMKTISIVSQKWGAGKTTLTIHLAVAASQAGMNTAVIDLDPQASSTKWADRRQAELPRMVEI